LKGSGDRALIPLLRTLGFIDQAGTPTPAYRLLKSAETSKQAIGNAIRGAYGALFEADENAHKLTGEKLKGLVAQVAGTDDDMTARIVNTFNNLTKLATFEAPAPQDDASASDDDETSDEEKRVREGELANRDKGGRALRPEFHYNIQIHLPSNATEDVYLNIFNAIRKTFQ
jgi:hypothetical protein